MSRKLFTYSSTSELIFDGDSQSLKTLIIDYHQPFWLYKKSIITERISWVQNWKNLGRLHYAMKANFNPQLLKIIKEKNCGIDAVSLGEMKHALANGFKPVDIILSGVAKTKQELKWAIENEIYQINIESESELTKIIEIARDLNKKVSLALRVNPEVDAGTHPGIATALKDSKFGLDFLTAKKLIERISLEKNLDLKALSFHIGSQVMNVEVFRKAIQTVKPLFMEAKSKCPELERLDLGGGLGIDYQNADSDEDHQRWLSLQKIYDEELQNFPAFLILEIGRFLTARSGVLISKIEVIKSAANKKYMILDAGMSLLLRPALYQAQHQILPLKLKEGAPTVYTVVGPICESSDVLAKDKSFSFIEEGDFVCICDVGAYGSSMSSRYNLREDAQEIFID